MIKGQLTISAPAGKMPAYIARPESGAHPAVIVLEGIYGFDEEIRRMTDLVASAGFVGCAIDYLRGESVQAGFKSANIAADIAAARDWLNDQSFVSRGKVATWGFGVGGSAAFMAASLPGISSAISFYGQSIAKGLPDGGDAPIKDAEQIRTPLLLVFGGRDEQITEDDIERIKTRLNAAGKKYDVQIYANVGHSFFREDTDTMASREIADAWDRVQSFLSKHFK
ncbi:MAG: dienelactone hydrolase family protein [Candidatus Velthaea sp.]